MWRCNILQVSSYLCIRVTDILLVSVCEHYYIQMSGHIYCHTDYTTTSRFAPFPSCMVCLTDFGMGARGPSPDQGIIINFPEPKKSNPRVSVTQLFFHTKDFLEIQFSFGTFLDPILFASKLFFGLKFFGLKGFLFLYTKPNWYMIFFGPICFLTQIPA